jgi:hypothetical protein
MIKIVVPGSGDYLANQRGASSFKPVSRVTQKSRRTLAAQVDGVRKAFASAFEQGLPAVAVVQLHEKAIAKYKRPKRFFQRGTCPIIGYGAMGQLWVSVSRSGLRALKQRILRKRKKPDVAQLSAIDHIAPFRAVQLTGRAGSVAESKSAGLRLRLFRHATQAHNFAVQQALKAIPGVSEIKSLKYADGVSIVRVKAQSSHAIAALQSFVGTQSLSRFPRYELAEAASTKVGDISEALCPLPDPTKTYAVAGQFDSGVSDAAKRLQPWIIGRHSWYPAADQDNDHGTFVAGLICNAHRMNHNDPLIPQCAAKIVDVVVFDKSNQVEEGDLLDIIDDALERFPDVRVWNLSLSQPTVVCSERGFSPLAIALDFRARQKNVLFVVSGGNLPSHVPPRRWPISEDGHRYGDDERICAPGDSVRSLPIGGIAHRETPSTIARIGDPSPIVRKGPGGVWLISPLLAGSSGNCDENGHYFQSGVLSTNAKGELAESIGISFALPPLTAVAATVEEAIRRGQNDYSVFLAKAMMLHAAFKKHAPIDEMLLNYQGLGPVPSLDEILFCEQSSPTVVFQAEFQDLPQLCKRAFPLPKSVVHGKELKCEILMTLLYDPPLDGNFAFEYVRSNIDAHLGVRDKDGHFTNQVEPHLKFDTRGPEKSLLKYGFKWSPIKLFYTNFYEQPGNELGAMPWELRMRVFRRAERTVVETQPAFLFVTIRDRTGTALLYDEWIRQMNLQAWETRDLSIDQRVRVTS